MKKNLLDKKYYIYCLIISIVILLFTSKNSFFYAFNDWVDANAFFTVGKSMMNGIIPYKDLFEQKGPLLYLIYGIGYLIENNGFHGVFTLEVISFTIFLCYTHKIVKLFLDEKTSLILIPIYASLVTTSTAFVQGGSCEEFALPLMTITLYYFIKHFKDKKLTNKEVFLIGLLSGLVFLLKFTILGLWIGVGIFIVIDYLLKKEYKETLNFCIFFLIGVLSSIIPFVIYFIVTNSLKEFIYCYIIFNIKYYPNKFTVIKGTIDIINGFINSMLKNIPLMFMLIYLPFSLKTISKDKKINKGIIFIMLMIFIPIYAVGHRYYKYYFLSFTPLLIIPLISIIKVFKKYLDKKTIYYLIPMISIIISILGANYREQLFKSKEYYFQYKYAKYISKYNNPTLLNMNSLDLGLYTVTGIIPKSRYFELQNIDYEVYPENIDEMEKYVKNKEIKFIIYGSLETVEELSNYEIYLFKNYELVYSDKHKYEKDHKEVNVYLFKLKGLKE